MSNMILVNELMERYATANGRFPATIRCAPDAYARLVADRKDARWYGGAPSDATATITGMTTRAGTFGVAVDPRLPSGDVRIVADEDIEERN